MLWHNICKKAFCQGLYLLNAMACLNSQAFWPIMALALGLKLPPLLLGQCHYRPQCPRTEASHYTMYCTFQEEALTFPTGLSGLSECRWIDDSFVILITLVYPVIECKISITCKIRVTRKKMSEISIIQ